VRKRSIPAEEAPVAFFFARHAGVSPEVIIDLRLGDASWMDIMLKYGISPEILYIELEEDHEPPFGKAYGHFKNKPRDKWRSIRFTDQDIIEFVNIRFISEKFDRSPDEIIKLRQSGSDYIGIVKDARKSGDHRKEKGKLAAKTKGHKKGKDKE